MSMSIDWLVRNHLRRIIHEMLLFSCRKRKENTIFETEKQYSIRSPLNVLCWAAWFIRIWSEILLLFAQNMCNKRRPTLHAIACHSLQQPIYITLMPFNITLTVCVYVHIDMIVLYLPACLSVCALRAPRCARCLRSHRWCRPSRTQTQPPCATLRRLPS